MKNYPLAKPHIGDREKELLQEVLDSGILSIGPKIEEFEKKFAELIGTKYACAVNSGTSGLHLAMLSAGIKEGDEVITTPFSFIASANCILYVEAKPVFVDIDEQTYNIDPTKIEASITPKTKAILVVHIFGQSADMVPIMEIAKKHNLLIIEDACESVSATYDGKNVGTFGQSSVFAFYPNKQMTTGEGGMICTDDERIFNYCKSLRNQGRDSMEWLDHRYLGYNYRMDEMSAAVGLAQLEKIEWLIKERQKIANWYDAEFLKYNDKIKIQFVPETNTHTRFVYTVELLDSKIDRNSIILKLRDLGIASKEYLPSIHLFNVYKERYGYKGGEFPVSELVSSRSLALPFYVGLTEEDIKFIVEVLIKLISL
ncbi:MAG: DegT/DnrJ/EryC1/StrS family aminotransferase [bacterium]|nr:DegT/DnrJ/EryC1/StrS family aminotransferase [bacterium]